MSNKLHTDARQFPGQHQGETVKLVFNQHPLVMRKALIIGLLAIVMGVLPLDFPQVYASDAISGFFLKVALVVPVIVFAAWFWRWVGWYYSVYIVTNERIVEIKQKGFFDRAVEEWQLDRVQNVNYHVGGFQAVIFGFGDITIRTFIGDLVIPTVHHPVKIHERLQVLVREGGGGIGGSVVATPYQKPSGSTVRP
jgi:membrane protein YdbS with pleckstrin-like domain